jgi:hypothetical protein
MSFEQGRHHIFRDGLFVTEAIAHDGRIGKCAKIDGVVARARHMEKLQSIRARQIARVSDADDDLRFAVRLTIGSGGQDVWQDRDPRALANEAFEAFAERGSVLAMKYDSHRVTYSRNRSRGVEVGKAPVKQGGIDLALEYIEHAVHERDQLVRSRDRLVDMAIGDGVEYVNVAID